MNPTEKTLRGKLAALPRLPLIHLPTPMRKLERLSAELGGPEIWIKRDDLTGLAFGGNKSRKLEYIIPDALAKKADVLVTWGATQSNWAMQAAAAAAKSGLHPVLVLFKSYDLPEEADGNILLDRLLGAEIRLQEAVRGKLVTQESRWRPPRKSRRSSGRPGKIPILSPTGDRCLWAAWTGRWGRSPI